MSVSLPDPDFYRLADVTPGAATLPAVLDAIHAADWTADYRSTALPAAYQWAKGRYQNGATTEAFYLTPPSGTSMTRGMAILLAGAAAAGSATFEADTFLANALHAGVAVNPGSYNAWNAAAPFTSGGWAGFNRAAATAINSTGTTIRIYVSKEIIVLDIWSSATAHYPIILGALLNGYSATQVESDSRLYGCITQGSGAAMSSDFTSNPIFFDHSTTVGNTHAWVYQPGTASVYRCGRNTKQHSTALAGADVDGAGVYVAPRMGFSRSTGNGVQNGAHLGWLRGISVPGGTLQGAQTRRNGATDLFHVVGTNSGSADDFFLLTAAA